MSLHKEPQLLSRQIAHGIKLGRGEESQNKLTTTGEGEYNSGHMAQASAVLIASTPTAATAVQSLQFADTARGGGSVVVGSRDSGVPRGRLLATAHLKHASVRAARGSGRRWEQQAGCSPVGVSSSWTRLAAP